MNCRGRRLPRLEDAAARDPAFIAVGLAFARCRCSQRAGRWDAGFRFHFGPYIAIAALIALYWGEPILRWYAGRL